MGILRRSRQRRGAALLAALVAVLATLSGCGTVEVSPTIKSCSPSYVINSEFGKFSAQQAGRGKSIAWGAYPNAAYSGTNYYVKVYAGGVRVDTKNQSYAPHGSLSADRALKYSGKIFELDGTVTRNGKLILKFELKCRIA